MWGMPARTTMCMCAPGSLAADVCNLSEHAGIKSKTVTHAQFPMCLLLKDAS